MEDNQELNQEQQEEQQEERRFTQADLDAMFSKGFAKGKKGMPSDEEMAAFNEWKSKQPQDNAAKLKDLETERDSVQTELEMARRENWLLRHGVDAEDVDYYVYKVSKAMEEDEDFEEAAKKFLKEHKPKAGVRVDMGGRLTGGGGKKSANETMNDLLRAARG